MPRRAADRSLEVSLKRCRKQAESLSDPLLLCLIDMTLLHLRRKAGRQEVPPAAWPYLAATARH
jgi:hypothetical protein